MPSCELISKYMRPTITHQPQISFPDTVRIPHLKRNAETHARVWMDPRTQTHSGAVWEP